MTATPADARAMSAMLTVDLAAVRENYRLLARRASVPLVPMVKADAYGLGATPVARALAEERPHAFGVASVAEGVELREAGIVDRIMVFSPVLAADFGAARQARLVLSLANASDVAVWSEIGGDWQLPVDTGMNRSGVDWRDIDGIRALLAAGRPPVGVFTHFHSADTAPASIAEQETRFAAVLAALPSRPALVHAENSAALLQRGRSRYDTARPGIALYGVTVGPAAVEPAPVVTLSAPVVVVRCLQPGDTVSYGATWRAPGARRIATVALGYADGFPRDAGNRAIVLVRGTPVPVVGLVTMDMSMIDVTDVPCEAGDNVTFIGVGSAQSVAAVAAHARQSPYEVLTGLRSRVRRGYTGARTPGVQDVAA